MAQYTNILLDLNEENGVAVLTINRADKLNALNRALLEELDSALDYVAGEERIRALVITGAGTKAFVAGADISEIAALQGQDDGRDCSAYGPSVLNKIER